MSSVAVQTNSMIRCRAELRLLVGNPQPKKAVPSNEVYLLGAIIVMLQVLDGMLTFQGISLFGTQVEGNLFLRNLMEQFGTVLALISVKSFAILCVGIVCFASRKITWIPKALWAMIGLYICAAVMPWIALILCA